MSFVKNHPGLVITLSLGYLSSLGLIYQVFLLGYFGLNASDYFSTSDFLLAFIQSIPTLKILLIMHFIMIPAALIPAASF